MPIRLHVSSVPVDDQERALAFYTETLGFAVKNDLPLGDDRWLTLVGAEDPDGVELLLEPDRHPATRAYKSALVEDGIPIASFLVDDVVASHLALEQAGVRFTQPPVEAGPVTTAVLDDTCGNLVQIVSMG